MSTLFSNLLKNGLYDSQNVVMFSDLDIFQWVRVKDLTVHFIDRFTALQTYAGHSQH